MNTKIRYLPIKYRISDFINSLHTKEMHTWKGNIHILSRWCKELIRGKKTMQICHSSHAVAHKLLSIVTYSKWSWCGGNMAGDLLNSLNNRWSWPGRPQFSFSPTSWGRLSDVVITIVIMFQYVLASFCQLLCQGIDILLIILQSQCLINVCGDAVYAVKEGEVTAIVPEHVRKHSDSPLSGLWMPQELYLFTSNVNLRTWKG